MVNLGNTTSVQSCNTTINSTIKQIIQYHNQLCNYAIPQSNVQLCNTTINCAIMQYVNSLCNVAGWWVIIRVWPFPALGTGDKALRRQVFIPRSIHASIHTHKYQYSCKYQCGHSSISMFSNRHYASEGAAQNIFVIR